MSQPQSAKRMRSNTSNEVTPQTAPGLRGGRPPSQSQTNSHAASVGLYASTGYNGNYGALPAGRQDVAFGSYATTNQPGGYLQAPFTDTYDPHAQSNAYNAPYGQQPSNEHITNPGGLYTQTSNNLPRNGVFTQVTLRQSASGEPETYPPPHGLAEGPNPTYNAVQGQTTPSRQSLQQSYGGESYPSYSLTHNPAYHSNSTSYPDPTVNPHYSPPPLSRINTNGAHRSSEDSSEEPEEEHGSDEDAQGETADEEEDDEVCYPPYPPRPCSIEI